MGCGEVAHPLPGHHDDVRRPLLRRAQRADHPHFRWITPGSLLAILIALAASAGFGLYVAYFGTYNETYGTLGAVIIFLVWMWIFNLALLFGAEFNSELERGRELESGDPGAEHALRLPPRERKTA